MSHIVEIQTEVRDLEAIRAACQRLELPAPEHGTFQLFSAAATGWGVTLQNWRYPVVCELETGRLHFDNFGGRWGKQEQLDRFLQRYAVEKAALEARKQGYSLTEQQLQDGSIKLTVTTGGAA